MMALCVAAKVALGIVGFLFAAGVLMFCAVLSLIRRPRPGVCYGCGCTDDHACAGGCAWADETRTLCTKCDEELAMPW